MSKLNREQIGKILEIIFDKPDFCGMYMVTQTQALLLTKTIYELTEENERLRAEIMERSLTKEKKG